jgi:hypothetical protein
LEFTRRASSPFAFTRALAQIGFVPAGGRIWVCDALPQRNCGRFARPSLLPEVKKNAGQAYATPTG